MISMDDGDGASIEPRQPRTWIPPAPSARGPSAPRADDGEGDARRYLRILWGRRRLLLASTLAGVALAALYTARQPRLYQTRATIEFKQVLPPGEDLDMVKAGISITPALAVRILTTNVLASRVLAEARGEGRPWAGGTPAADAAPGTTAPVSGAVDAPVIGLDAISRYYGQVSIRPVAMTNLADIVVTHPDPRAAAEMANAHAAAFIEIDVESKVASLNDAQGLFRQQLEGLRDKLEASRQNLASFQREHGILSLPEDDTTVTRQAVQRLNRMLTEAQGERIVAEATLRNADSMADGALAATLPDDSLQGLRNDLLGLESSYEAKRLDFGRNHPDMMALRARIDALRARLAAAATQVRAQLRAKLEAAKARETELRRNFEKLRQQAGGEDRQLVQLSILQREVESDQELYSQLLQQAKEVDLDSGGFRWTNVKLADRAVVPTTPALPRTGRHLAFGLLFGILSGLLAAVLLERLDDRIHTPEDVVATLQLPAYGVVPDFHRLTAAGPTRRHPAAAPAIDESERAVVTLLHPASIVSEAYRSIRTNLLFSSPGRPPRTILVTSSHAQEGKTVTVVNLAISLALSGGRVLVVDADLRNPSCHVATRVPREPGLTNVLTGQCDPSAAVVLSPLFGANGGANGSGGVYVLPAGALPPNPAELLGSAVMSELLEHLKEQFEFVLIDSPPVLPVTDSVVMATKADGVLLVVRGGEWGRDVVRRALERLDAVRAPLLGVVLNRVDVTRGAGSHYYRHYYRGYQRSSNDRPEARA